MEYRASRRKFCSRQPCWQCCRRGAVFSMGEGLAVRVLLGEGERNKPWLSPEIEMNTRVVLY